ncbi:MAG: hypothetical protein RL653_4469 [Pseudomonadota bacterium]|jgi:hypothetical protein
MPVDISRSLPFDYTDTALPWGLRRFGRQLAAFQQKLDASAAVAEKVARKKRGYVHRPRLEEATRGHRLHAAKGRGPLFMLEGLSRIALGTGGDEAVFGQVLAQVKVLEDGLGEVDFWWAFLESFEKMGLPVQLQAWAETHHAHACGKLEGALEAGGWVEHRHLPEGTKALRVRTLGRLLEDQDWPGAKKERRKLAAFIGKKLRRVHEAAQQLDMNDLEHGLHELRRKLRWFSIYAACLEGAVTLDKKAAPPKGWGRYMAPEVVNNPFNQLPAAPGGVDPVLFPAPLFYALSWMIAELGAVKDRAQLTETVDAGIRVTGLKATAKGLLGTVATSHAEAAKVAQEMVKQTVLGDRLLLRLADAVDAQG